MSPVATPLYNASRTGLSAHDSRGRVLNVSMSVGDVGDESYFTLEKLITAGRKRRYAEEPTSTGSGTVATIQAPALAGNRRVCEAALKAVSALPGSNQKRLARTLLSALQKKILDDQLYSVMTPFRPIKYVMMDDGAILLDWAYMNGRVSFYIDQMIGDSVAIFLDGLVEGVFPETHEREISAGNVSSLASDAVRFASRLA